jgi:hypothetical protein
MGRALKRPYTDQVISYALAEQLRDAGFPQGGDGKWIGPSDKLTWRGSDRVYVPTLSELIEASSYRFGTLSQIFSSFPRWTACAVNCEKECLGSTPEEAVARLFLELHAKSERAA